MTRAGDGVARRLCRGCGQRDRLLRRVGSPTDPDAAIAICARCDGPAAEVRPHPRDHHSPRRRLS